VRGGISVIERDALGCRGTKVVVQWKAPFRNVVVLDGKSRVMWCVKTRGQNSATFSQPFATKCRRRPEPLHKFIATRSKSRSKRAGGPISNLGSPREPHRPYDIHREFLHASLRGAPSLPLSAAGAVKISCCCSTLIPPLTFSNPACRSSTAANIPYLGHSLYLFSSWLCDYFTVCHLHGFSHRHYLPPQPNRIFLVTNTSRHICWVSNRHGSH
jgi:hypothetical protein